MSRWADYRAGRHRRASHVTSREEPASRSDKTAPQEKRAQQARIALEQMGVGYSCLSLYLSSRIDLLNAEYCREFALTPDCAPPLSTPETQSIVEQELGTKSPGALLEFNYDPLLSTLLAQYHSARLASGIPVLVVILRPEYFALQTSVDVPPSFNMALVQQICGQEFSEDVFLDFFSALRRKANFIRQAEILENLAGDNSLTELLSIPRIYRELSATRLMTLEPSEGMPLATMVQNGHSNTDVLARRLCQVWLQQALCGQGFPVDPQPHNTLVTEDNRMFFVGCELTTLSSNSRDNLWNYMMATIVDDPDRATLYLLREMYPLPKVRVDGQDFRSKFRQAAYFGALAPVLGTNSNALPQLIFQHWKTALEYGQIPKPDLLCFYRGLFAVARIAHGLSALGDPMREGLEEVRACKTVEQVREIADWRYWYQNSDKFATAFMNLPKIMDDALTRASVPPQSSPVSEKPETYPRRRVGALSSVAVLVVLAAVIFASRSQATSPFNEKFALLLLFLAGLLALKDFGD